MMSNMKPIKDRKDLPPGLAEAFDAAVREDQANQGVVVGTTLGGNAVIEGHATLVSDHPAPVVYPSTDMEPGESMTQASLESMAASQVAKILPVVKDKLTITITHGSPLTPHNSIYIGTSDVNKNYSAWLKRTFDESLTTLGKQKQGKNFVNSLRFLQVLCYMALCEDQVGELSYRYEGPDLPRKFNPCGGVIAFVRENKKILQAIAPFYNVHGPAGKPSEGLAEETVQETAPTSEATADTAETTVLTQSHDTGDSGVATPVDTEATHL